MKKFISIFIVTLLLLSFTACDNSEKTVNSPDAAVSEIDTIQAGEGTSDGDLPNNIATDLEPTEDAVLGDYYVLILDSRQENDYYGNNSIVVSFEYTNNSSENQTFANNIFPVAVQDGEELERAYMEGSADNNINAQVYDLEPGNTITVDVPFVLLSESPVVVSVTGTSYSGETNLQKTFTLEEGDTNS